MVETTNELLVEPQEVKKKLTFNDHVIINKNSGMINSRIKNRKKNFLEKSIPKEIEDIILEAESSQRQSKINKSAKKFNQENKHSLEEFKVSKDELIESMHKTFLKKIKRNTLKLILDLREEIISLTKNISSLKEQKKQEEFSKKILKKNVIDLTHVENELRYNLKKTQTDFNLLKEQNKNLILDHALLKEHNKNLNRENVSLKNNFLNLRKILIQLINQTNFLKNNNIKINSQLNAYKNKELASKSKIKNLEKEILINSKLLNEANDNYQDVNINDLETKIKHYQEENIRISNELVESNKKSEITKESLNELESHRSGLIEKINSINEVIQNENIVTNVFRSDLNENKIKVINRSKPKKKNMINLNDEIKNIFSNK